MDLGALMGFYEQYANVIRGNDPLSRYEEYERVLRIEAFLDSLAIKLCGDVY